MTAADVRVRFPADDPGALVRIGPLTGLVGDTSLVGVDFNPAADALRVISDQSQNLRHSLPSGTTTTDTNLTNPPVPPATVSTPATGVTMAGYTNNDLDAGTGTTLFDIDIDIDTDTDTDLDRVAIQAPANNGTLNPTGTLGTAVQAAGGLDVSTGVGADGRTDHNVAYAALATGPGATRLYRVSLLTGDLVLVGRFGDQARVVDLSFPIDTN